MADPWQIQSIHCRYTDDRAILAVGCFYGGADRQRLIANA
jgi:hypothetical protein